MTTIDTTEHVPMMGTQELHVRVVRLRAVMRGYLKHSYRMSYSKHLSDAVAELAHRARIGALPVPEVHEYQCDTYEEDNAMRLYTGLRRGAGAYDVDHDCDWVSANAEACYQLQRELDS